MADETRISGDMALVTDEERARFYELFNELEQTKDPAERERILNELAKLTYGS